MKELYDKLRAYAPACEQEEADRALMLEWLEACPEKVFTRESRAAHFTGSGLVVSPELDRSADLHRHLRRLDLAPAGTPTGMPDPRVWRWREAEEETGRRIWRP